MTREIVEAPTLSSFMQREEADIEQKDTGVRGHQIPESPAANFLLFPVENDREVSGNRHPFPDHEKNERIMNNGHKLEREDQQREKGQVPANGKVALHDVVAQVANCIETRREREELKGKQKKQREPIEADQDRPSGGKFKTVFQVPIAQQRVQRKTESTQQCPRVEQVGRDVKPATVTQQRRQEDVRYVQRQADAKQGDHRRDFF